MLFAETKYLDYKFPEPQYLGAKIIHRGWIAQFIPEDVNTVLDAFSGSKSIAYMLKQLGKKVVTNDFLNFNNLIGKALVENPGYVLDKQDINILFSENSRLKQKAKVAGITVDNTLSESQQMYTLSEKLSEIGCTDILDELKTKRKEVVTDAQTNTIELMTWLYANQGEMRFGAENRLFVILVDTTDMSQSWKMKRAFSLIEPKVNDYLNNFNGNSLKEINFTFKKKSYKSLADVVFVVKE